MQQTLLQSWQEHTWPEVKVNKPLPTGEGVIDQGGFNTIEVDELFESVNQASTTIGQAVLFRTLTQPLSSLPDIESRQQAVLELGNNQVLKDSVERIIENAASHERHFYLLLFGEFLGALGTAKEEHEIEGYGYLQYKRGVRFLLELVDEINAVAEPESAYLKSIFDKIKGFANSRAYSLMEGPVYIT
ncbi:MAG: DNA mismatch repair protein MutS, partial [Methylobacter sp.]|nr:DNA mismatch repair protein MutS [Methylobacter sp.]